MKLWVHFSPGGLLNYQQNKISSLYFNSKKKKPKNMQEKEKETDCEEERELKLLRWLFDEDCDGLSDVVH
jgi:hypothetical protein